MQDFFSSFGWGDMRSLSGYIMVLVLHVYNDNDGLKIKLKEVSHFIYN